MGGRIAFFAIIFVAILLVILIAFVAIFEGWTDVQVHELKEKVANLQSEATQAAKAAGDTQSDLKATVMLQEVSFTATVQSLTADIEKISQTATSIVQDGTVMAEKFTQLSTTATSVLATVTAQAPVIVRIKQDETASLFSDKLNIRLDGYSGIFSSNIKFTVQSPNSVGETFKGISPGEVVLYKGYKNYTILVSNSQKDEEDKLIVEFIVAGN